MVDEVYRNAFKEVYLILENTDENLIKNIPDNFINFIKENMNEKYEVNLDFEKSLEEQNILEETRGIIALIYRTYLATDEEKDAFSKQQADYIKEKENKKIKQYKGKTIEEFFNNPIEEEEKVSENLSNNKLIKSNENLFKKIFVEIKKWFKK